MNASAADQKLLHAAFRRYAAFRRCHADPAFRARFVVEYRARISATNGQCGGHLRTGIAPVLQPGDRVNYLGDLDLAGNQIEDNTRRALERKIAGPLAWERLALTREQVREHDLPVIVKRDNRYNDKRPHEAVETEAISQRVLIDILTRRLDRLLPEPLGRRTRGPLAPPDRWLAAPEGVMRTKVPDRRPSVTQRVIFTNVSGALARCV
jgi:hypothetical protein